MIVPDHEITCRAAKTNHPTSRGHGELAKTFRERWECYGGDGRQRAAVTERAWNLIAVNLPSLVFRRRQTTCCAISDEQHGYKMP